MEGSDLDLLKDIPGFKAIVRAVLKSQMKQLVEHLSEHGGEEALLFTTSVSDGTFHYIGSTAAKGFLDGRQDIKSQFIGHCMKGGKDTEVPNVHAEGVVQASSDKTPPFIVSKTSPNVVTYTSRRSSRAVTLPLRYMSSDNSPVIQKGVGETTETQTDNLQTSRSKAGSKVSSPKKGRGKNNRKRPSATVTSETPMKRSAIEGTITKALDALSAGQEQESVGGSIKIENNFSDPDNAEMDDSNSSGTLSLDQGQEPSLDTSTNIKDGQNNDNEPNELEHSGPDFQIKIEPADNDSGDNEDHTDDIDVGVNPGQEKTTGTGPSAEANTTKRRRTQFSVAEKKEIVAYKRDHPKATQDEIGAHFEREWKKQIGRSTISEILRDKEKWSSVPRDTSVRQRSGKHENLEQALFTWYTNVRSKTVINDDMMIEKAKMIGEQLGVQDFGYSKGWLQKFKRRHLISKHVT